ncbi:MAG: hypothetical protein WA459_10125 [Stellaceae bacterium]
MRKFAPIVFALLIAVSFVHQANAQAMSYRVAPRSYAYRADPAVNNYLSAVYDHRLQVDPRFRSYRKWRECHIITWPGLRPDCIASFDQYEPVLYRAY